MDEMSNSLIFPFDHQENKDNFFSESVLEMGIVLVELVLNTYRSDCSDHPSLIVGKIVRGSKMSRPNYNKSDLTIIWSHNR